MASRTTDANYEIGFINGIQFGVYSPEVILKKSVVNINVDTFIGEEEWFTSMMKSYNVNILPRMQKNAGNETRSFTTYNGLNQ